MQASWELIECLNLTGKKLSKSHRRIAEYIVEHDDKAVFMTASQLGQCAKVSESTVVRFATALGYEGYPELQRALKELVSHHLTGAQRVEIATEIEPENVLNAVLKRDMANLRNTLDNMDSAVYDDVVQRILHANTIYVMGLRSAAPLAQFMGYYLNFIFDHVQIVSTGSTDVFDEIAKVRPGDVMVAISFPRYSNRTLDAMLFAKRAGAEVIAITDGPMSPLCRIADATLLSRIDMASFVDSLAGPLSVINALLVSLGLQRKEALTEHYRQLESVWGAYKVYRESEETEIPEETFETHES
ncbi:MAG: MurR/RpiR family transcriptional regulator [Clostridia bacterium]|nr:MurR/RpiR family transcriptional regulator [Clostridia bacterium]